MRMRFKNIALGVTVIALAVHAFAVATTGSVFAADEILPTIQKVLVVNSDAEPVPVSLQGTGSISGDVTVDNDASNPVPVSGDVKVTNDSTSPVPINGKVQAEQGGVWNVNVANSPTVQAQQSGDWNVNVTGGTVTATEGVATKSWVETFATNSIETAIGLLPETINASMIVVSTEEGENIEVTFSSSSTGQTWMTIGGVESLPAMTVIPLPQRIPINQVFVTCSNAVEDCDATISIVGD